MSYAIRNFDRDEGSPGIVAPRGRLWTPIDYAIASNRAYSALFTPSRPMSITGMKVVIGAVGSTGVADEWDLGIFDEGGNVVDNAGKTTGALTANSLLDTGAVNADLDAGTPYYAAFIWNKVGVTGSVLSADFLNYRAPQAFGATAPLSLIANDAAITGGTIAGPTALAPGTERYCPILWLYE